MPQPFFASYVALQRSGELARRAAAAAQRLAGCDLCPRRCGADRLAGERGICATARQARIASVGPHFGEEAPLVGCRGSGTIFFSGCNLRCCFCQNDEISHGPGGALVDAEQLAEAMLLIQQLGCHNLNLVTPTHVTAQILAALCLAAERGLTIPLVYNCGGYEALPTLALLDGVVDIYMPDLKYTGAIAAQRCSDAADYPEVARAALREMQRQVGELQLDETGVARRGLLVRHLVLPADQAGSAAALRFIADELSPRTYVNVMDQYRPCGAACADQLLGRRITRAEYEAALQAARDAGLERLDDRAARWR